MLDLFSFIIKVILSVAMNYGIVYFLNKEDNKSLYSNIILLSILISSFIAFMYILAHNIDNYICFNISLFITAVLYVILSKNAKYRNTKIITCKRYSITKL